jgi:hypothetical protein
MEPERTDQFPPADLSIIGSTDDRGRTIADLVACTIRGNFRVSITTRFGVADLADAIEGAKEFAGIMFEETAHEYLAMVPDARPHPDDALVTIILISEVTGQRHEFQHQIPEEYQPNSDRSESKVFYRF